MESSAWLRATQRGQNRFMSLLQQRVNAMPRTKRSQGERSLVGDAGEHRKERPRICGVQWPTSRPWEASEILQESGVEDVCPSNSLRG
jgi:hypothetical protein